MTALIILAGIIGIPLLGATLIKREYRLSREISIAAPASVVYNYLRFLKNQDHFSKWVMADPHKKVSFRGTDGTKGAVYGWNGDKKSGEGEQEIIGLTENKKIDIEIRFVRPFKNTALTPFTIEQDGPDKCRVSWSMIGRNRYPMTLMNLFVEKLLGPDMEESLANLKTILEKQKVNA